MKHRRRSASLIAAAALAAVVSALAEDTEELPLWPGGAPGSEGKTEPERVVRSGGGERSVSQVHAPSLTPFLPNAEGATKAAVVILPGGGHRVLAIDHEGFNVAEWLRQRGVTALVLKYRLAKETNSTYTVDGHALADVQRAVRMTRAHAAEWGVDPDRVGVMGFSAGGELAALACLRFDPGEPKSADPVERFSCKPSFQALIYPGSSQRIEPTPDSPPAFLACAYDDRPDIAEGLAEAYLRFRKAGVRAELHIYATGGHGFGVRPNAPRPVGRWMERLFDWMGDAGYLKTS